MGGAIDLQKRYKKRGAPLAVRWRGWIKNSYERSYKTKRPPAYWAGGLENPAATYSPGPVGQVPSAMRGLTSVFGKGTGMTPSR